MLSVPDGRSVRTLVNAAPVQGEDGAVASVVVTFQDLAPLDEVERLRTEFLGLVSHELREPRPNSARKHQEKAGRKSSIRAGQTDQNVVESTG